MSSSDALWWVINTVIAAWLVFNFGLYCAREIRKFRQGGKK